MTARRFLLAVAASVAAFGGDATAQPTPAAAAEECMRRLDAGGVAGEAAVPLVDLCPELAAAIETGAWADALGDAGAERLAARPLRELLGVITHYERVAADAASLGVAELEAIVVDLGPLDPVVEMSLWGMLSEWLKERLGFGDSGSGGLVEWLRNLPIPDEWVRTLVYVLGITIVVAALIVALNELRVSGVLGRGAQPRGTSRTGLVEAWTSSIPRSLDAVRKAPTAQQPVLLLALLVERLRTRYGEQVRDSMTHRELVSAADAFSIERRGDFAAVVSAAERVTYASWRPDADEVEPVLSKGRGVLDELESAAPAGPADPA